MSSSFEFLKEYNKSAYNWASNMERTLYNEPLGALAFGGRFLESIRNALYQHHYKQMNKSIKSRTGTSEDIKIYSDSFKREDFTYHISSLYHDKAIKSHESKKIIAAYNIRHNLHLNEDVDDIESDKEAALKLYKEVFEIAVWFCKHIDPTFFDEDLEFEYPNNVETEDKIPEVNLVKIFDRCVICGKDNASSNRNICPECKRKIRLGSDLEDLIDLLDGDNRFSEDFLKKNSYDKYEIDYMIHFLREFDLRSSETKGEFYLKDNNTLYDFIDETKSYEEVEKILIAYYNELIDAESLDYTKNSYYRLGETGDKRYREYYHLIIDKKIKHYLNLKLKNYQTAMDVANVNIDEISNWYTKKVKDIIKSNYKKDLDISFNQMSRILMERWNDLRENQMIEDETERRHYTKDEIKEELKLSDEAIEFWFDDSIQVTNKYPFIKEFIFKNREIEMKLFVEGLSLGLNKEDSIAYADSDLEFIDKQFNLEQEEVLRKRWRIGKQFNNEQYFNTFKSEYFRKKTKSFLESLKGQDINSALEESDFDIGDFNTWYGFGKKEFLKHDANLKSDLLIFYTDTTRVLMDNWLDERKKGRKKLESCKNIGLYSDTLDEWFRFKENEPRDFEDGKYDIFKEFYVKSDEVTMDLIMTSIENGDNKTVAAKNADSTVERIDNYLKLGKEGNDEYVDFYEKYEEIYLPKRREEFLRLFEKKGDFNKAVKASELSLEEIRLAYENGENGEEEYMEFYENLLDLKLKTYAEKLSLNEKEKRALEKSDLTQDEIEKYDYRIEILILATNMGRILDNSLGKKKLEKIVDKSSMEMNDIFDWYTQGKRQYEEDDDLEYLLLDEDDEMTHRDFILKDRNYKENIEKDFSTYYKNFYNHHHELYVKSHCRLISKFLDDGDEIRFILKSLKITKKEFKFWDELGLIKRGEEESKQKEEWDSYEKAMKLYKGQQWEESLEHFKKAFEINPHERLYLAMQTNCLEKMEKYEEAIKIYDELLKMKHTNKKYLLWKAECFRELEKYEDAIENCKKAKEFRPDDPEILGSLTSALISLGKINEALETLSSTEKTIKIEISADDGEKLKEMIEDQSYNGNLGEIKISKNLEKYIDDDELISVTIEVEELGEFLKGLKTGVLPE